ncbi:MAG: hypothetical protein RIQ52_1735 [Pseudomonadota bacterium]|jgi:hemoglobin
MMTPYDQLGGAEALHHLVDRFYHHMDTLPEAARVRALHGADLSPANQKLFMFLSGWLGGPNLFIEQYGHPRLRARHFPFAIDRAARDEWMLCMQLALDEVSMPDAFRRSLTEALANTATHMINQPEPTSAA